MKILLFDSMNIKLFRYSIFFLSFHNDANFYIIQLVSFEIFKIRVPLNICFLVFDFQSFEFLFCPVFLGKQTFNYQQILNPVKSWTILAIINERRGTYLQLEQNQNCTFKPRTETDFLTVPDNGSGFPHEVFHVITFSDAIIILFVE